METTALCKFANKATDAIPKKELAILCWLVTTIFPTVLRKLLVVWNANQAIFASKRNACSTTSVKKMRNAKLGKSAKMKSVKKIHALMLHVIKCLNVWMDIVLISFPQIWLLVIISFKEIIHYGLTEYKVTFWGIIHQMVYKVILSNDFFWLTFWLNYFIISINKTNIYII